jgi:GTPase
LLKDLGIDPIARYWQKRPEARSHWVVGSGKLAELKEALDAVTSEDAPRPVLVFDGDLSPGQMRALEQTLETEALDRTQIILKVFSERARTTTARLEVELARLKYEAPRARDDSALDQAGGGGGRGGQGHTAVELRKQDLRRRTAELRQQLARETTQAQARRERRAATPRAALVGYTNAGKSSLLRALTGADTLVEDKLFATLGTTVRALDPPTVPRVLVADTVGFIRNLPNHLLASFRSTLEEALDAHLLLLTVDASDSEWQTELAVTRQVLKEVGAEEIPSKLVFNKTDRLSAEALATLRAEHPEAWFTSAVDANLVAELREAILAHFHQHLAARTLLVPYRLGKVVGDIHARAHVLREAHRDDGTELEFIAEPALVEEWSAAVAG